MVYLGNSEKGFSGLHHIPLHTFTRNRNGKTELVKQESKSHLCADDILRCTLRTFRMYDLNGDGMITKTELANVLVAVCELMGIDMRPPVGGKIVNGNLLCKFGLQGR